MHVRDNGLGFDSELRETIFEPFSRLTDVHAKGHGLGLAICKAICVIQGWSIPAIRVPGQGTELWYSFGQS